MSNKTFTFDSRFRVGQILPMFGNEAVKAEPMLHKCDLQHALEFGGPMTKAFIDALPHEWLSSPLRIDSRTHMLMKGWWPCIPGWHHDDVPRERSDGQPNYENSSYQSEHVMALWGDCSLTEFAVGKTEFQDVPLGGVFYKEWHPEVDRQISDGKLTRFTAPERRLIFFDWQSWHQGAPATKNGWRFFIRATRNTTAKPANEIRHQTQIYMSDPMSGW